MRTRPSPGVETYSGLRCEVRGQTAGPCLAPSTSVGLHQRSASGGSGSTSRWSCSVARKAGCEQRPRRTPTGALSRAIRPASATLRPKIVVASGQLLTLAGRYLHDAERLWADVRYGVRRSRVMILLPLREPHVSWSAEPHDEYVVALRTWTASSRPRQLRRLIPDTPWHRGVERG